MLQIGNVSVDSKVVLAPMAGVSNPAYIHICEDMGPLYAITELISSEAIVRDNKKTFDMLNGLNDLSVPVAVQIFGSDPLVMGKAAKIICDKFNPLIIDINMGCPVPKVAIKAKSGSFLLKDPDKVRKIVSSVVDSVSVPVTVKIRSGWDSNSINAPLIARICEEAGASAISVHARTRALGYGGTADWNIIKEVKSSVSIPVIGNGDVKTIYDAKRMIDDTSCDAVMIGRAALGNPWLIKRCNSYLENGIVEAEPSSVDRINMIKKHYDLLVKYNGTKQALLEIRSHALWYLKGLDDSKRYKNLIMSTKSEEEFYSVLDNILLTIESKSDKLDA